MSTTLSQEVIALVERTIKETREVESRGGIPWVSVNFWTSFLKDPSQNPNLIATLERQVKEGYREENEVLDNQFKALVNRLRPFLEGKKIDYDLPVKGLDISSALKSPKKEGVLLPFPKKRES
jgi:hypothetical protein